MSNLPREPLPSFGLAGSTHPLALLAADDYYHAAPGSTLTPLLQPPPWSGQSHQGLQAELPRYAPPMYPAAAAAPLNVPRPRRTAQEARAVPVNQPDVEFSATPQYLLDELHAEVQHDVVEAADPPGRYVLVLPTSQGPGLIA